MAAFHKSKDYLLAIGKWTIIIVTFWYVWHRLTRTGIDMESFYEAVGGTGSYTWLYLLLFFILAAFNWTLEIEKWRRLASTIEPIGFSAALNQTLASLTVSLATPNRIGDYGAKALYFPKENRKRVLVLNFFSNYAQLAITLIFGLIGLLYFMLHFNTEINSSYFFILALACVLITVLITIFRGKRVASGKSVLVRFFGSLRQIPSEIKWKILTLSLCRYLLFCLLFCLLLAFFGAQLSLIDALMTIFSMYIIVSIIPNILLLDVIVRSGVAVWLFTFVGVSELIVLSTVLSMWVLNFVLPSVIGSFYVLNFRRVTT